MDETIDIDELLEIYMLMFTSKEEIVEDILSHSCDDLSRSVQLHYGTDIYIV